MTAELRIPVPTRELTWDDLQVLPDELHHHYELIEGQILMSPSPSALHQSVVLELAVALRAAAPRDLKVYVSTFDFVPEPATSLQPDVLVLRRGTAETNRTVVPPVLAIEVLSPRRRTFDLTTKRELYARFGVAHYWIVDPGGGLPGSEEPSLLALQLASDGRYAEVASVSGDETFAASAPFAVEFTPAALVAD